jgi:hypothetical protein
MPIENQQCGQNGGRGTRHAAGGGEHRVWWSCRGHEPHAAGDHAGGWEGAADEFPPASADADEAGAPRLRCIGARRILRLLGWGRPTLPPILPAVGNAVLRLRARGFARCRWRGAGLAGLEVRGVSPLESLRQRSRENNHILENPCIEWVGRGSIRQKSRHRQRQLFIEKLHLLYRRSPIGSDERLCQLSKDSVHRPVMNVGVGSIQIRKRLLDPPIDRFKQEPGVISTIAACV